MAYNFKDFDAQFPDDGGERLAAIAMEHPSKILVPLAEGLAWGDGNYGEYIYQEKLDGRFASNQFPCGGILVTEFMPDGEFIAFDCVQFAGANVRDYPLVERLLMRNQLCQYYGIKIVAETTGPGGEFLRSILNRGGEGICRKRLAANYWEAMTVAKRGETWLCRVAALVPGTQSVEIEIIQGADNLDFDTACQFARTNLLKVRPAGRLALRGGKIDKIRVGSILRVEGMTLTAAGKIRQPNPAREWLVKY